MKVPTPVNAAELEIFAAALNHLDAKGLQVEGRVYVPGTGHMTVAYDDDNYTNTITSLEVDA